MWPSMTLSRDVNLMGCPLRTTTLLLRPTSALELYSSIPIPVDCGRMESNYLGAAQRPLAGSCAYGGSDEQGRQNIEREQTQHFRLLTVLATEHGSNADAR